MITIEHVMSVRDPHSLCLPSQQATQEAPSWGACPCHDAMAFAAMALCGVGVAPLGSLPEVTAVRAVSAQSAAAGLASCLALPPGTCAWLRYRERLLEDPRAVVATGRTLPVVALAQGLNPRLRSRALHCRLHNRSSCAHRRCAPGHIANPSDFYRCCLFQKHQFRQLLSIPLSPYRR